MTIKSSGGSPPTNSLSFSEIAAEFGSPTGNKLGSYRGTQIIDGKGYPLDQGIQQGTSNTDQIKFSDFFSKKLNIVIDCFSGTTEIQGNARQNYNSNKAFVVRNFHAKPNVPQNCRIIIKVNKTYQTAKHASNRICALKSGGFHISNDMVYDIGSNAVLLGSGGKGGEGSRGLTGRRPVGHPNYDPNLTFQNGGDGSSCLGLNHDATQSSVVVNIDAGAVLRCGFGGGGGGGGAQETSKNDRRAGGGGGGGGAGTPFGDGGKGGVPQQGTRQAPNDIGKRGGNGTATTGGSGAGGGDNDSQVGGARGGDGGQDGNPADAGNNGSGEDGTLGGFAGQNGAAIRINTGGTFTLNKSNQATVIGATNATGVD